MKLRTLSVLGFSAICSLAANIVEIDFSKSLGPFKPLHGVNKGPLVGGGLIDLTPEFKAARFPLIRLHDCRWPNPDVVDIHTIFPDFTADPALPENYTFGPTDEYLEAIQKTGAQIYFRLGESIEHTTVKRHVHPPKDPEKWAQVCLGIIRHYNEGWAGGTNYNIQFWEIWNEPENQPAMWTGSDEQFLKLYEITAKTLKKAFPELKIGGPGIGNTGRLNGHRLEAGSFLRRFLKFCQETGSPLDFFSWHCYADDPAELVVRAREIRELLNQNGFQKAESHLNEWNFLPDNDWGPVMKSSNGKARQRFYERMAGSEGAAFVASALLMLQDSPVDRAMFFHGELGGFGLFNEHGVPNSVYAAFRAFSDLEQSGQRCSVRNDVALLTVAAGIDASRSSAVLVLANRGGTREVRIQAKNSSIPWSHAEVEFEHKREDRAFRDDFPIQLPEKSVIRIRLTAE